MDTAYWTYDCAQLPDKQRTLNYVLSMGHTKDTSFCDSSFNGVFHLLLIESGSATLETANTKIPLSAGSACWIDSNSSFRLVKSGQDLPWSCYYLTFYGSFHEIYISFLDKTEYVIRDFDMEEYLRIFLAIRAEIMAVTAEPYGISLRIYELVMFCCRAAEKHKKIVFPPYYFTAVKYLKSHFDENISSFSLAKTANCSVAQLHKAFKRYAHTTPQAYAYDLRFKKACALLRTTELTLDSIANECGFAEERALNYLFRKKIGKTPGAYRRELRGSNASDLPED